MIEEVQRRMITGTDFFEGQNAYITRGDRECYITVIGLKTGRPRPDGQPRIRTVDPETGDMFNVTPDELRHDA